MTISNEDHWVKKFNLVIMQISVCIIYIRHKDDDRITLIKTPCFTTTYSCAWKYKEYNLVFRRFPTHYVYGSENYTRWVTLNKKYPYLFNKKSMIVPKWKRYPHWGHEPSDRNFIIQITNFSRSFTNKQIVSVLNDMGIHKGLSSKNKRQLILIYMKL